MTGSTKASKALSNPGSHLCQRLASAALTANRGTRRPLADVCGDVPTPSRPRRSYCAPDPWPPIPTTPRPTPGRRLRPPPIGGASVHPSPGTRDRYFCRIRSATIASCMLASSSHHPGTQQDLLKLFFRGPLAIFRRKAAAGFICVWRYRRRFPSSRRRLTCLSRGIRRVRQARDCEAQRGDFRLGEEDGAWIDRPS